MRNSFFTRALWGLMGLYLLNISVDTADPNPEYIPEDLSFNDQESLVEIFVEQILGYENAIKEYDDHDTEDHNKEKSAKIDLLVHLATHHDSNQRNFAEKKKRYHHYDARLTNGFNEIASPPPKA